MERAGDLKVQLHIAQVTTIRQLGQRARLGQLSSLGPATWGLDRAKYVLIPVVLRVERGSLVISVVAMRR